MKLKSELLLLLVDKWLVLHRTLGPHSTVPGPTASATPGSLLKMWMFRPQSRLTESEL